MKKFKLFLCGLMAIAFTACSNDDPLQTICELPTGTTFRDALIKAIDYKPIESIKFEANSSRSTTNGTQIGSSTAYALVDGDCLYVYTTEDKFVFHQDCSYMFSNLISNRYYSGHVRYVQMIDFGNCVDTSNVTAMSNMFSRCEALSSLDLSSFDTSNVTNMSSMFDGCYVLSSLDLSSFDTSNVTNMSSMFAGCDPLSSLDLSNFDTSNVTDMSNMFNSCNLASLDLSSFDTSNVTDMSDMFNYCADLSSLDLSNFDTSNVTNMSNMFYYCFSLKFLDLSSFDTSNVTNMECMFQGCDALASLDLCSFTFDATNVYGMFYSCENLNKVYVRSEYVSMILNGDTGILINWIQAHNHQ